MKKKEYIMPKWAAYLYNKMGQCNKMMQANYNSIAHHFYTNIPTGKILME